MAALLYTWFSHSAPSSTLVKPGETTLISSDKAYRAVSTGQSVVLGVYDTANKIALIANVQHPSDTQDLEAKLREFSSKRTLLYGVVQVCTVGGTEGQSDELVQRIHACLAKASLPTRPHSFDQTLGLEIRPGRPGFIAYKR